MSTAVTPASLTVPQPTQRRWVALAFIALAQLMAALDATIVSIALPSAQRGEVSQASERPRAMRDDGGTGGARLSRRSVRISPPSRFACFAGSLATPPLTCVRGRAI